MPKVFYPAPPTRPEPYTTPTVRFLERLQPNQCRWPIGDPKAPGFGYCGRKRITGRVYCKAHDAIAWKPDGRLTGRDLRALIKLGG